MAARRLTLLVKLASLLLVAGEDPRLPRVPPNEFELRVLQLPLVLALLCYPTDPLCTRQESEFAAAAVTLAGERPSSDLRMVDLSQPGGRELLQHYGAADTERRLLLLLRHGAATPYTGTPLSAAVVESMRALARSAHESAKPAQAADTFGPLPGTPPDDAGLFGVSKRPSAVLSLDARSFAESTRANPLLFVLFHSRERGGAQLLSNFTFAAESLREQSVAVRLGQIQVSYDDAEQLSLARRFGVNELPDIKIFQDGRPSDYQAGADALDLIDVARWNAGFTASPPSSSRVIEVEGQHGLDLVLMRHPLLLLAFTTRWCTRCLSLAAEFHAASTVLASAGPVALGVVNVDDPRNRPLVERFGVLSFPVGKIFFRGRFIGDYLGGTTASAIVAEMRYVLGEISRAEETIQQAAAKDEL